MSDITELYRAGPDGFTARRDALAKQLKDPAVKKLRRPTLAAWAVDVVAIDSPELVEAVIEAGEAVRTVQTAVLGGDDPGDLREATARRKAAVAAAVKAAMTAVPNADRDKVTATFDAAAASPEAAAEVAAGTLAKELDPPMAFELLDVPEAPARAQKDDMAERREKAATARRRATDAEHLVASLEDQLRHAKAELKKWSAEADRLEADL